jgi:hypothetical protein
VPEYAATCDRPTPRTRALCHEPLMRARTSFTPLVHSCRSWGTSGPCRVAGAGCAAEGEAALPRPPGMPLLHRPPPRTWVPRPPVLSGKDRSRVRPEWAIARHTGCDQSRAMSGLWRRGRRSRIRGVVGGFHRGSPHCGRPWWPLCRNRHRMRRVVPIGIRRDTRGLCPTLRTHQEAGRGPSE